MESYKFIDGTTAVRKSDFGNNYVYVTYYAFWSKIIFMEAVPYAVIFILNTIIVSRIYDSIRFRKRFANATDFSSKRESSNPKVKDENRRQSTPLLRKREFAGFQGRQHPDLLSASNLSDDDDGNVAGTEQTESILSTQASKQVRMNNENVQAYENLHRNNKSTMC